MNRRCLLGALAALLSTRPAVGEHGWKPDETSLPLYLEGEVTTIIWADPHPHLELLLRRVAGLPPDLLRRPIPRQKEHVDAAALLGKAVVPAQGREIWRVELPTLARLRKWDVRRPKIQHVIGVLGYAGPPLKDTPTLVAEFLFIGDKAYPMRSDPA